MIKNLIAAVFILGSTASYSQSKENIYAHFGNLVGTWEMRSQNASIFEEWKIVNDTLLEGISYKVENGVKTVSENVRLVWRNNNYHYEPIVSGQNEGSAIIFTQTDLLETKEMVSGMQAHDQVSITFSDPSHDYPQYIRYTIKPTVLVAKVGNDSTF